LRAQSPSASVPTTPQAAPSLNTAPAAIPAVPIVPLPPMPPPVRRGSSHVEGEVQPPTAVTSGDPKNAQSSLAPLVELAPEFAVPAEPVPRNRIPKSGDPTTPRNVIPER
jgi:hypothetical protein